MKRTHRQHGVNGWTKGECQYSPTGWAWHYQAANAAEISTHLREFGGWYTAGKPCCTCEPCTPLRTKETVTP